VARDALEIPLVLRALDRGWPVLGICRGEQILNVALGGSLVQDVPSWYGCGEETHRHGSSAVPEPWHGVEVMPGSLLERLMGRTAVQVNSRHHQAVARVAGSLRATAWDPATARGGERLVEGVESADPGRWVLGVQWHPENLARLDDETGRAALSLFQGFVSRAG
jgi:putative glutamine amidotransferase